MRLREWPEHRALSLGGVNEPAALALALGEGLLVLAQAGRGAVGLYGLEEALRPRGQLRLAGEHVAALALDWVTLSLYWRSEAAPGVHVTSASGKLNTTLLRREARGPGSLALHPPSGRLCFAALGPPGARLECAFMDGRNGTLLWKSAVAPTSLTFSTEGDLLYWANTGEGLRPSAAPHHCHTQFGSLYTLL